MTAKLVYSHQGLRNKNGHAIAWSWHLQGCPRLPHAMHAIVERYGRKNVLLQRDAACGAEARRCKQRLPRNGLLQLRPLVLLARPGPDLTQQRTKVFTASLGSMW